MAKKKERRLPSEIFERVPMPYDIEDLAPVARYGELQGFDPVNNTHYKDLKERIESNEFMRTHLSKGKYDIDYVINLLKILIEQCDYHQLNRHDLPFSLRESCKKLIANLMTEKCGKDPDPRILVTCDICKESVVIPKRIAHHWKCPCNNDTKKLEVLD